jgi:hypothetical protein
MGVYLIGMHLRGMHFTGINTRYTTMHSGLDLPDQRVDCAGRLVGGRFGYGNQRAMAKSGLSRRSDTIFVAYMFQDHPDAFCVSYR